MHSPFQDSLHTNFVPTDTECDDIRALIQGPLKDLAKVTEEIARLHSMIDEAAQKRDELDGFIRAHMALEIFLATLPSTRNAALIADEAPLLLCRICRSWRLLALATPRLWASIHIVVTSLAQLPQLTEKVTAWLDRSRAVPLDISLVYSRTASEIQTSDVSSLTSLLVAASRRWRNIKLVLTSRHHFAALSSDDVPLLQSIAIRIDERFPPGPLMFLGAKSLRSVECVGISDIHNSSISWGSLTQLTLASPSIRYQDAFWILCHCPLLETSELSVIGGLGDPTWHGSPLQPISLLRLRHLSVKHKYMVPIDAGRFFDRLILPAIRSFHCYSATPTRDTRSLFPCMETALTYLECLTLDVRRLASDIVVAALADMPSLEELHLVHEPRLPGDGSRDPQFLTHLTPASDGAATVLCPNLRYLELKQFREVTDDTLLQFIISRTRPRPTHLEDEAGSQPVQHLDRFSCALQRPMQRDIKQDIQSQALGLQLDLTYRIARWSRYSPLEGLEEDPSRLQIRQVYFLVSRLTWKGCTAETLV
ncbi:hypothetical protein K438DRAFT_1859818 [Mycena galopus ATCC 62051]|nr:hypothetical protein K438DRAFT_1859818 [Mycena galopus ATCC 62051]